MSPLNQVISTVFYLRSVHEVSIFPKYRFVVTCLFIRGFRYILKILRTVRQIIEYLSFVYELIDDFLHKYRGKMNHCGGLRHLRKEYFENSKGYNGSSPKIIFHFVKNRLDILSRDSQAVRKNSDVHQYKSINFNKSKNVQK